MYVKFGLDFQIVAFFHSLLCVLKEKSTDKNKTNSERAFIVLTVQATLKRLIHSDAHDGYHLNRLEKDT